MTNSISTKMSELIKCGPQKCSNLGPQIPSYIPAYFHAEDNNGSAFYGSKFLFCKVLSPESFWKPAGSIIFESLVLINNPFNPLRGYITDIMFYGAVTILLTGPLKQMARGTLIEFLLMNICYLSAVWQRDVWSRRRNLFQLRNLGQESGGTIQVESPGASSHLTAPVLLASAFPLSAQTQPPSAVLSSPV